MSLPLQLYDFISILFPGIVLLTLVKIEFSELLLFNSTNQYEDLAILFVFAYVLGHLLQGIIRTKQAKRILKIFESKNNVEASKLIGRHFEIGVSKEVKDQVDDAIINFYGVDIHALQDSEKFDLIYSPVVDRMGQRQIFVAIANFLRAMGVIAGFLFIVMFGKILSITWTQRTFAFTETIILFIALLAFRVFSSDAMYFKRFTDTIPYYAFLAWYKEKKL
ncbi:MAG: hypothetical protein KGZ63_12835 [Clostridiales bacterium]|jgi:hypothetical protein|nr:hypothetical protein [Clostridiales bacterium]